MDFHSLTRRELQALCKKNKIPANMTNVAMADALQSLEFVDGIEEVLKTCESDVANSSMESPGKSEALTSVPRTGRRTTQQKTIKHSSETLQTSSRSLYRTRGSVLRDVDAKNDMHETPALPTTRRRAATTSVRCKLESAMKECESKEKTGDQVEEEKKDVPQTPAAALTSQRKEVKAKSRVRQVYSTRRSVRLAGKPMQESSTQEDEKLGTLTFDAVAEETDECLEVDSKRYSVHKTEELDKNGIDLKSSESLDIKNEPDTVSGQDSNTLVQNEIDMEDCIQQDSGNDLAVVALDTKAKDDSEEVALGDNNNGSEEISGEEPIEESEIDSEAKKEKDFQNKSQNMGDTKRNSDVTDVVLTKQLHEQDEPHCGDTSDFLAENDGKEEDNFIQMFECQVDEDAECNSDVAGKQELIGEPVSVYPNTNIDFHKVNLFGQFNSEVEAKVSGSQQKCLTNIKDAGEEEPIEEYEVYHSVANVDSVTHGLEVAGEEEPMEEYDVDCTEDNVDAPADTLEVAGGEKPMEESEVDYAEATVEAVHSLLPLPLIPDTAQEDDCEVKVSGSQQCLHVSETNTEVAGEEPMEEFEIDHEEANVALPPPASLIPNAAPEPVFTWALDPTESPSALASTNSELITQTPLENSLAATSIGQILVSDNKENLVCSKENKGIAGNDNNQSLQNLSLRKLTKMLKDLQISKDPSGKEVAKNKAASSRSALQTLPENRLISETEN